MTMIERVARAIARVRHGLGDSEKENLHAIDYHWPIYIRDARAAIEAMRTPTGWMISAGAAGSGEDSDATAIGAWTTMIDAALKEST